VRDISDTGARLQFDKPLVLTELLDLHIPIKGQKFPRGKRWHNGDEIGVAFMQHKTVADDINLDRRMDRLRKKLHVLKKAISIYRKRRQEDG
jgi:hypothetical protein